MIILWSYSTKTMELKGRSFGEESNDLELVLTLLLSFLLCRNVGHSRNTSHTNTSLYEAASLRTSRLHPCRSSRGQSQPSCTPNTDNSKVNCCAQSQASFKLAKSLAYPNTASVPACTLLGRAKSRAICHQMGVRGLLSAWVKFSCSLLD